MNTTTIKPPGYPLRPTNGGPLPLAPRKDGHWIYEPKVNGWRAWLHCPTGHMFNRHLERLSIESDFKIVTDSLKNFPAEWLDVEAFERRHNLGRGSIVVLDYLPFDPQSSLDARQEYLQNLLQGCSQWEPWQFMHRKPPENAVLTFAYHFTDYGIDPPAVPLGDRESFPGEDIDGIHTNWEHLQRMNKTLRAEVFEGMVAKRRDSLYPVQRRSAGVEFPFWVKHRWAF